MEWQPIETAPIGQRVEVGRYRPSYTGAIGSLAWETDIIVAREMKKGWVFWASADLTHWAKNYTHWRALPPPPANG